MCVWVNRATGQLGNWATGQLVPSGDNGATGRRRASATSTQPSYLPTFGSSYLPYLPSFLPSYRTVPSYLSGDPYLWSKIGLCGSPLMRSALPVNEDHLILVFFCRADLAPTETHERHRNRETATRTSLVAHARRLNPTAYVLGECPGPICLHLWGLSVCGRAAARCAAGAPFAFCFWRSQPLTDRTRAPGGGPTCRRPSE